MRKRPSLKGKCTRQTWLQSAPGLGQLATGSPQDGPTCGRRTSWGRLGQRLRRARRLGSISPLQQHISTGGERQNAVCGHTSSVARQQQQQQQHDGTTVLDKKDSWRRVEPSCAPSKRKTSESMPWSNIRVVVFIIIGISSAGSSGNWRRTVEELCRPGTSGCSHGDLMGDLSGSQGSLDAVAYARCGSASAGTSCWRDRSFVSLIRVDQSKFLPSPFQGGKYLGRRLFHVSSSSGPRGTLSTYESYFTSRYDDFRASRFEGPTSEDNSLVFPDNVDMRDHFHSIESIADSWQYDTGWKLSLEPISCEEYLVAFDDLNLTAPCVTWPFSHAACVADEDVGIPPPPLMFDNDDGQDMSSQAALVKGTRSRQAYHKEIRYQ